MTEAIAIGRFHDLAVIELVDGGILLDGGDEDLFLPSHLAPDAPRVGDVVTVFVYSDHDGAPQATTHEPACQVGEVAYLECVSVTRAGAYLAWGLPKDLYAPPAEQEKRMVEGRSYVVAVVLDKKGERLIASSRVTRHLDYDVEHLRVDDEVSVLVYGERQAGVEVVVDGRHRGLIHRSTVRRSLPIGSTHVGYVRKIREDNRLDIELTRRGAQGSSDAQARILAALREAGGSLPLHDRSSPAAIERALGLSKKAFKRAAGGLYKARRIVIDDRGIRLVGDDP